jgi:hypothetical protein
MPHKGPKDWFPGDNPREFKKRIKEAVEAADQAFWIKIAKAFPEARKGDFAPGEAERWDHAVKVAVYWWLYWNHPKSDLVQEAFGE